MVSSAIGDRRVPSVESMPDVRTTSLRDKKPSGPETASVSGYMDFFPRAVRALSNICLKIQKIWKAFIQFVVETWRWLIGYKAPEGISVRTPEAADLILQAEKYQDLAGVDRELLQGIKRLHGRAPAGTDLSVVASQACDELRPEHISPADLERVGLLVSALALKSVPILAASNTMLKALNAPEKLPSAMRAAGDLAVLAGLNVVVGDLSPVIKFLLSSFMLGTLASHEFMGKSLSEHAETWLLSSVFKASEEDRLALKDLEMPPSASNLQRRALEKIKGQGSKLDVKNAIEGLFGSNPVISQSRRLKAIQVAARTHHFVGALGLSGVTAMVTMQFTNDKLAIGLFPAMVFTARVLFPQVAGLERRITLALDHPYIRNELAPSMKWSMTTVSFVTMFAEITKSIASADVYQVVSPWVGSITAFVPTVKQWSLLDRKALDVALNISYNLPARITAYVLTNRLFGHGLVGTLCSSVATAVVAEKFDPLIDYDKDQPVIAKAQVYLGAFSAGSFALTQLSANEAVSSLVASSLPFVASVLPSCDQIDTFSTQSRVCAVSEWTLASAGKMALAYGVEFLTEPVLGSSAAGVAALATVSIARPTVDLAAKEAVYRMSFFSDWVVDRTSSLMDWATHRFVELLVPETDFEY